MRDLYGSQSNRQVIVTARVDNAVEIFSSQYDEADGTWGAPVQLSEPGGAAIINALSSDDPGGLSVLGGTAKYESVYLLDPHLACQGKN